MLSVLAGLKGKELDASTGNLTDSNVLQIANHRTQFFPGKRGAVGGGRGILTCVSMFDRSSHT